MGNQTDLSQLVPVESRIITIYVLPSGDMRWVVTERDNPYRSIFPYTGTFGKGTKRSVLIASLLTDNNKINSRPDTHRFPLKELVDLLGLGRAHQFMGG